MLFPDMSLKQKLLMSKVYTLSLWLVLSIAFAVNYLLALRKRDLSLN